MADKKQTRKNGLPDWEVKDRVFRLKGKSANLASKWIQTKDSKSRPLQYFDGERNRVLRYATNFDTPFEDEQDSTAIIKSIRFKDGSLFVPAHEIGKGQFLTIHPDFDKKWYIVDAVKDAENEMVFLDLEFEASKLAREADFSLLEAILRGTAGSRVDNMSSAEIKKDTLVLAKRNPKYFLELANDSDLVLRNVAIKAFEAGFLSLGDGGTTVIRTDNKSKLFDLGFNDNHFAKTSQFFKKDEGLALYKSIVKKLK